MDEIGDTGSRDLGLLLDIWPAAWGLPSMDRDCLSVLAYCRFANVPVTIHPSTNPWKSGDSEGLLPVLRHQCEDGQQGTVAKVKNIMAFLRKNNFGTDFDLTLKQSADFIAFNALLEEKFAPALQYLWWVHRKTYSKLTRPSYVKVLPFPLGYYITNNYRRFAERYISYLSGDEASLESYEAEVYKNGKECLNILSKKLGNQQYFFGDTPSSLDAIVFGYLAPLLKAPFPVPSLQNHLKACANLCQFCKRVLATYFPGIAQDNEPQPKHSENVKTTSEDPDFPNKKRNMIFFAMVALCAMVGYASASGLLQIEFGDDRRSDSGRTKVPDFNQFDKLVNDEQSKEDTQKEK